MGSGRARDLPLPAPEKNRGEARRTRTDPDDRLRQGPVGAGREARFDIPHNDDAGHARFADRACRPRSRKMP
jgi:hypothetical protein